MLQDKINLAIKFEIQGQSQKALDIYKELLKENPENDEIKDAIKRIAGFRKKFLGVNEKSKEFFINMKTDEEFKKFERWLLQIWN